MTQEKCTLSNEELIAKCSEWIDKLCKTGGSAWSLSVPVNFDRDPDMLFNELINRFKTAYTLAKLAEKEFKLTI